MKDAVTLTAVMNLTSSCIRHSQTTILLNMKVISWLSMKNGMLNFTAGGTAPLRRLQMLDQLFALVCILIYCNFR